MPYSRTFTPTEIMAMAGYQLNPGHSDLDNEQSMSVRVHDDRWEHEDMRCQLGDIRQAKRAVRDLLDPPEPKPVGPIGEAGPLPDLEKLTRIAKAAAKVAPGEWDSDLEDVGDTPDWQAAQVYIAEGPEERRRFPKIVDSINSEIARIHEDWDEDGGHRWDEYGRAVCEHIAAFDPPTVLALLAHLAQATHVSSDPTANADGLKWRVAKPGRFITISQAEENVGNAVLSPEEDEPGCYWTLIGQGPEDQQNALAEIIAAALNAHPDTSRHVDGAGWADLIAAEFAKPQFMTTTADSGHYSINFSFVGDGARERCHALEDAFRAAGRAINGPAALAQPDAPGDHPPQTSRL